MRQADLTKRDLELKTQQDKMNNLTEPQCRLLLKNIKGLKTILAPDRLDALINIILYL